MVRCGRRRSKSDSGGRRIRIEVGFGPKLDSVEGRLAPMLDSHTHRKSTGQQLAKFAGSRVSLCSFVAANHQVRHTPGAHNTNRRANETDNIKGRSTQ